MVISRHKKIKVINRSAIKSLRAIMQEDFAESVFNFLENSAELHAKLHSFMEASASASIQRVCVQFSESCQSIGAEILAEKLLELKNGYERLDAETIEDLLVQIDQLYDLCRVELQNELSRPVRIAS